MADGDNGAQSLPDAPHLPTPVSIDAYGNGGFRFGAMSHRGSLLCLPDGIWAWPVRNVSELTEAALAPVFERAPALDLFLIGAGRDPYALPEPLRARFRALSISVGSVGPCVAGGGVRAGAGTRSVSDRRRPRSLRAARTVAGALSRSVDIGRLPGDRPGGADLQYPAGGKAPRRRGTDRGRVIAHGPEKWEPVFGQDHAQNKLLNCADEQFRALRGAVARSRPGPLSRHTVRAGRAARRAVCALCLQRGDRAGARSGVRAAGRRPQPAMVARGLVGRARRRVGGASGGGGVARDAGALRFRGHAAARIDR